MTLLQEFRHRRKTLGTQADAARELCCSVRYIQKLEAGHAVPSASLMKLLRLITPPPPDRSSRQPA
jgi:predicted transcriptional regulator